ncbi:zinc finger CCHC domain-containing protein 9-like isoform X2 [Halichondria panicea]|uniref:zinc finger CCHC domain-containing protein 9-like isoform X2 n=1 Tax=Halichondria panicea TaxID=6063 RepID=UPI00312B75D7
MSTWMCILGRMTRTARIGSKGEAHSSTPWAQLKTGYKSLQDPQCDTSDSDEPVSSEPTLGISKKEKLKTKKKKVELSAKAQLKKMTRKDLEAIPLLSESPAKENGGDHKSDEVVKQVSTKNKHSKKSTSDEHSSSISKPKKKRSKKKSKVQDIAEDKIPLLDSMDDSQTIDVNNKTEGKKPKNKTASVLTAKKAKPKVKLQETIIVDERREKKNEARRLRRRKRKVCFNCRESGHHVSECTKSGDRAGTGMCFKCGASSHTSKNCKARMPEGKSMLIAVIQTLSLFVGEYPYAKCFICGEVGHLSRACPENPKGLYPHGGGCNLCGSVEHFKTNCPTRHQGQPRKDHEDTVGRLTMQSKGSVDAEDFDHQPLITKRNKTVKSGPKVVTF